MDVSRAVYGRELKIAAMRALDAGATNGEIARKYQVSPHLLERWRGEWRAKGELAFLKRLSSTAEAAVDQRRFPADAPEGHIEPRRCRPFSSRYRNAIGSDEPQPIGSDPAQCQYGDR